MKKVTGQSVHSLSKEIKGYFIGNAENEFLQRLKTFFEIEGVEVLSDDEDDDKVIVAFPDQEKSLTGIIFAEGGACAEYNFDSFFVHVPFYYVHKKDKKNPLLSTLTNDLMSEFHDYEAKGMQKLFNDILWFVENIKLHKVRIEYIAGSSKVNSRMEKFMLESILSLCKTEEEKEMHTRRMTDHFAMDHIAETVLPKCRICVSPNQTVAYGKKWKIKFLKSPKLQTLYL